MAILNYSTTVNAAKTVSEIQATLAVKGAVAVNTAYENGQPTAVMFRLKIQEQFVDFRLPCNVQGVLAALKRVGSKVPWSKQNVETAEKVAWRIIKVWIEAQLALVEAGQAQMGEVFLPYAVTPTGQTLFQSLTANPSRLLGSGQNLEAEYIAREEA